MATINWKWHPLSGIRAILELAALFMGAIVGTQVLLVTDAFMIGITTVLIWIVFGNRHQGNDSWLLLAADFLTAGSLLYNYVFWYQLFEASTIKFALDIPAPVALASGIICYLLAKALRRYDAARKAQAPTVQKDTVTVFLDRTRVTFDIDVSIEREPEELVGFMLERLGYSYSEELDAYVHPGHEEIIYIDVGTNPWPYKNPNRVQDA